MIGRLLDDPIVWAAGVLLIALWCMGQALAGDPAPPPDSLLPARYVVLAPVPAGAADLSASPLSGSARDWRPPAVAEPVAPVVVVDGGRP